MTITAHCLIRNEENFIWYALQSVLPYVDKILVWDTGSTDKTVEIIKSINSPKIEFEEKGLADESRHTALRNEMIKMTDTEWFMILDGDEVWPSDQIKGTLQELDSSVFHNNCILSNFIFCVGDIYHYSTWGQYQTPWGLHGHFTLRFFRKVQGIHWSGKYDNDSLIYNDGASVFTEENTYHSNYHFFHYGVLPRSSRDFDVKLGHGRRPVATFALGLFGHGRPLPLSLKIPEVMEAPSPLEIYKAQRMSVLLSIKNLFSYIKVRL